MANARSVLRSIRPFPYPPFAPRYGVPPPRVPWMAPQDPAHGKAGAPPHSVLADGLECKGRTGRFEPAGRRKSRREKPSVQPDDPDQEDGHRPFGSCAVRFRRNLNSPPGDSVVRREEAPREEGETRLDPAGSGWTGPPPRILRSAGCRSRQGRRNDRAAAGLPATRASPGSCEPPIQPSGLPRRHTYTRKGPRRYRRPQRPGPAAPGPHGVSSGSRPFWRGLRWGSRRVTSRNNEPLPSLRTTAFQNPAPIGGAHTLAESVHLELPPVVWLECPLHGSPHLPALTKLAAAVLVRPSDTWRGYRTARAEVNCAFCARFLWCS